MFSNKLILMCIALSVFAPELANIYIKINIANVTY